MHGLCTVYADVYAWFTHSLRRCLRKVYARLKQGLRKVYRANAEVKGDADKGGLPPVPPKRSFPPPAPACLLPLHPMHLPLRPSTHSSPSTALRPPPSAGDLGDLHSFDPATMTWTLLSPAYDPRRPSARRDHGFTSAGGLLYVHGGQSGAGSSLSLRGARIRLP